MHWFSIFVQGIQMKNRLYSITSYLRLATTIEGIHMRQVLISLVLLLSLTGVARGAPAPSKGGDLSEAAKDELAKKLVDQVIGAILGKDLKNVMKLVDVPWYDKFDPSDPKVFEDRTQVEKFFEEVMAKERGNDLTIQFIKMLSYKEGRPLLLERHRKFVDRVLEPGDRTLFQQWSTAEDGKSKQVFLIRFRKGEAKLVGIVH